MNMKSRRLILTLAKTHPGYYVSGTSGQFSLWRLDYARMEKDAEAYSKEIATRISQAQFAKYAK